MNKHLLLLSTVTLLTSCSGGGQSDKKLKDYYADYFTIGATFNAQGLETDLGVHFNSFTCENEMKWLSIHPSIDKYDFTVADKMVSHAIEHEQGVRGHTLVWHNPKAMDEGVFASGDKDTVMAIEMDHIDKVVRHFGDKVYCWDVVNEVIDDGLDPLNEDGSNIYRKSNWYNICGRDFIKEAYIKTDAVLKEMGIRDKVKLFYNDYDNTKSVKKSKTLAMLQWLIDENVPIDGVGLQCHYHLGSFDPIALE